MLAFYRDGVEMVPQVLSEDLWLLAGPQRTLLLARGPAGRLEYAAYGLADALQLQRLRDWLARVGVGIEASPSPLFGQSAFAVRDPEGNAVEISAEIERIESDRPSGEWPHSERTLNLWGAGWLRS